MSLLLDLAMRHIGIVLSKGGFQRRQSLPQLCCRLMPTVRRRPTTMELAELVAGATVRRRLRGKQSTPRRLTGKQPPHSDSLPQSSSLATETAPEVEEPSVMPEEAEPWRPLTEAEKTAWDALSPTNERCATPWSTDCIENSGIQTSEAWWTVFAKIMLIPQCWRPPNSCGAQLVRRVPD